MLLWHILCVTWSPLTAVAYKTNFIGPDVHSLPTQINYYPARWERACLSSLESMGIKRNAKRLGVGMSLIEGANLGLLARVDIGRKCEIDECVGPDVEGDHDSRLGGTYTITASNKQKTEHRTVDMSGEFSCFARYANDRLCETDDNARAEWVNGKIKIIAKEDIAAGDEITYSYWRDFWIKNRDSLSKSARQK